MKTIKIIRISMSLVIALLFSVASTAQEKKINFDKGTLKICSNKTFNISGYDGNEVIIRSNKTNKLSLYKFVTDSLSITYPSNSNTYGEFKLSDSLPKIKNFTFLSQEESRKKGLKKMGSKYENEQLGINFKIEEKDGVLIFKDDNSTFNSLRLGGNESYDIKIPNTLKLVWKSDNCQDQIAKKNYFFFNTTPSTLVGFSGELEIESTLNNIELTDVTGLVAINNFGGNVTIKFDDKQPENLYSIYSNNGFIDMQIPKGSDITVDASAKSVYSDVDFDIIEEKELNDFGHIKNAMILKYGSGKVKIKLDAGYGNIYLRKK